MVHVVQVGYCVPHIKCFFFHALSFNVIIFCCSLFKRDTNKSWKLFGNHPVKIPNKANSLDKKMATKSKKPTLTTSTTGLIFENRPSNLPPKSAKEEQHHRQLYEAMLKGAKKREVKDLHQEIKKTKQQYQQENEIASSLRIWKEEVLVNWDAM